MRRKTVVTVALAAGLAAAVLPGAATAAAAPAPRVAAAVAGTYVPLAKPVRALDTRSKAAVKAGRTVSAKVVGITSVPASGVESVVVTLSALSATGVGGLTAWGAREPKTTNVQFAKGEHAVSATAVVPVTTSGTITIRNTASTGSVQVVVDVTGYYGSGAASDSEPGIYHSLSTASRVLDTRTSGTKKPIAAGGTLGVTIGGKGGVPADANAVAATVTVVSSTRSGAISAYREGDAASTAGIVHFLAGQKRSGFDILGLGSGKANVHNTSAGSVHLVIDVVGYYVANVSRSAGTLRPLQTARVLSTTAKASADLPVAVGGRGGVPLANVSAVVVTVHAVAPKGAGSIQAWRSGTTRPSTTAAFYFDKGVTTSNTLIVPVSSGRIALRNNAKATTGLVVDVLGYVPSNTVTAPTTAFVGRYPNDLQVVTGDASRNANTFKLQTDGAQDAGSNFVLLDLGAQSISPDKYTPGRKGELGPNNPGVSLALTGTDEGTDPVRIQYADLVPSLQAYVDAYAANGGTGEIAIGTNNDAIQDPKQTSTYYDPAVAGADWADKVIDKITEPAGVDVVGANDIEAGFRGDQNQALTWENAYLKSTKSTEEELIYNGSLDGCDSTFGAFTGCDYGWTSSYVKLTTNQGRVRVLPQVYVRNQSVQWANLDKASAGKLRYAGVLTESLDRDTFDPQQGWVALVRALSSVCTTVPSFPIVDIQPDTARG